MFIIQGWKLMNRIILLIPILFLTFSFPLQSEEVRSTLPGWSAGYRFYYDMDEDQKSKLRLFGKYKQRNGDAIKFGWDKQTGKDLNQFSLNPDDDGIIFIEQEWKF